MPWPGKEKITVKKKTKQKKGAARAHQNFVSDGSSPEPGTITKNKEGVTDKLVRSKTETSSLNIYTLSFNRALMYSTGSKQYPSKFKDPQTKNAEVIHMQMQAKPKFEKKEVWFWQQAINLAYVTTGTLKWTYILMYTDICSNRYNPQNHEVIKAITNPVVCIQSGSPGYFITH